MHTNFPISEEYNLHILDIPATKKPGFKPGFCFFSPEPGFASPEQILPAPKPGFGGKASGLVALIERSPAQLFDNTVFFSVRVVSIGEMICRRRRCH